MSWLQRLNETYDACFGQPQFESHAIAPIGSVSQRTQIEVALHEDGSFASAILESEETVMFVTEESAGRAGTSPAANPLTEQLEYCARGISRFAGDPTKYDRYLALLDRWNSSSPGNMKTRAILQYVKTGHLLNDLLRTRVLTERDGQLEKIKVSSTTKLDPAKLWVRWKVYVDGQNESAKVRAFT